MAHSDKYQDVLIKPGMDEKIDPRMLPMGTPRLLQNIRTRRAARFEKRPGTEALSSSRLPHTGKAAWMADWNGTAVAGINETVSTGQEDTGIWSYNGTHWGYLGRHGACVPHRRFGIAGRSDAEMYRCESVIAVNGLLYCVYVDESGTDVIYLQERTPEGVATRALKLNGTSPRIVWTGANFYLIDNESATVKVRGLNMADFTLGAATSLPSAAAASTTPIDVANLEGSTDWLICYALSSTELGVRRMTGTTASASVSVATAAEATLYTVAGHSTHGIVVAYVDTDALAVVYTAALGGASSETLDNSGLSYLGQLVMVRVDTDKYVVLIGGQTTSASAPNLTTSRTVVVTLTTSGGGSVAAVSTVLHFYPSAKPMRVGADGDAAVYCWCQNGFGTWETAQQARHILVDFEYATGGFGAQLAGVAYEHQSQSESGQNHHGAVADLGDGRFAVLLRWQDPGESGVDCAVFSLALPATAVSQAHRSAATSGGALYLSGGALSDVGDAVIVQPNPLDAACLVPENGFAHAPLISGVGATGGSFTVGQAYQWQAVYRQIDCLGRVHRSAAGSIPTGIVATGTYLKANLYVTAVGVSNRFRNPGESPVIEAYRSWNGGPYYFVAESASTFGVSTVTISDTVADATAEANPVLYTDLGIVPTEPPSGARLMVQGGQRLFVVGWRANVVQFSKLYVASAPWEFVDDDSFRIEVPQEITALGWMDGVVVIFTATRIYVVTGDGPNDQGVGLFSDPRTLPATIGADSPHIVETNDGLMYKGAGTIWLLPRGFGPPIPVGDAIQETLGRFPYLRAAFLAANNHDDCAHFTLASSDTPSASGYVAVYDNRFGSWSLDDIEGEVGAAAAVDGEFTWMLPQWSATTHRPVRQFDVSQFQDYSAVGASTFVEQRVEFGDWRPHGVLGQGRLSRIGLLGEYGGSGFAPYLNAVVTVDGVAEPVRQFTVSGAAGAGFTREIVPTKPAGTAYQLTLYDSQASGFAPSYALNALGIETDIEPGLRRPGEGERA